MRICWAKYWVAVKEVILSYYNGYIYVYIVMNRFPHNSSLN